MKKEHNSINNLIRKQLIGSITSEEKEELNAWLNERPENREAYERLMESTDFSERYQRYEQFDDEAAWQKFRKTYFGNRRTWMKHLLRVAAILAIVIGTTLIYTHKTKPELPQLTAAVEVAMKKSMDNGKNMAQLTAPNGRTITVSSDTALQNSIDEINSEDDMDELYSVSTQVAKEFWITLDDGTKVHLNYNTRLKYPLKFTGKDRTVYLDGEAFFNVAKDESRPFRVVTDHGVIRQYGTSFNVNTTEKPNVTQVVLVEGSVGLSSVAGKERMLVPGEKGEMTADEGEISVEKVDIAVFTSWNEGKYKFNDCDMQTLMSVLEHWYGKHIVFSNNELRKVKFTGSIDRYRDFDDVMQGIKFASGIQIEAVGNTIYIK